MANNTSAAMSVEADAWPGEAIPQGGIEKAALRKRLQIAVSSGNLNLAAMEFDHFPEEVMTMYETANDSVGWSEMVDLTKLNMGDNRIEVLDDSIFPDWSAEEMYEDDEKTNLFAGLELLDFRNNLLRIIPVGLRKMERLRFLNLDGNKLSNDILEVIWQIPNLQSLSLANNNLIGVVDSSFAVTRELRSLDLSNNKIEELIVPDGHLITLQRLKMSSNKLERVPWTALSSCELVEMSAASNYLSGTAFEGVVTGFRKLRDVDMSHNSITALAAEVAQFAALQTLQVNSNRLKRLPDVSGWKSLISLQASVNKMTEMPAIYTLPLLRTVDVRQNDIKTLDPRISNMESLTSLELGGNPLRDRKYLSMSTSEVKLDLEKRLDRSISPAGAADHSNREASPAGFLYKAMNGILDLSSRNLSAIDPSSINFGSSNIAIHTLRLQNNDFKTLPIELLCHPALKWSLRSLDVSHNPRLDSDACLTSEVFLPALQSLYVVSTGLTSLDALTTHLKAPELLEVNISCHRLAGHVPWIRAWYPKITTLLASDNWFSSVDVEGIKGLEVLDIRNNQIESLPPTLGLVGNHAGQREAGRLRSFECAGNLFRSPRLAVLDKGSEAVLKDLRRRVPADAVPEEWREEV
jgi:Leucine-rich repeat (LRR) protein